MRNPSQHLTWIFVSGVALTGCSDSSSSADAGADVPATTDLGIVDAGAPDVASAQDVVSARDVVSDRDVVTAIDGSTADAASADASRADATTADAATADAPSADAAGDAGTDASAGDAGVDDAPQADAEPMCAAGQHVCVCATGYYCLRIGAACLVPTAPCPAE